VIRAVLRFYRALLRLRPADAAARRHDEESERLLHALLHDARRQGRLRLARVTAAALLDALNRLALSSGPGRALPR
jgi:hypothetical protein